MVNLSYLSILILYLHINLIHSDSLDIQGGNSKGVTKLIRSRVESYVTRLHPNQDIMQTLTQLLKKKQHKAITISSATGSVLHCYIRFANQSYLTRVPGPLQVTSITGTFDQNLKPHLHISVANGSGVAFGGHLPSLQQRRKSNYVVQDCPIFTTLQLSLNIHKDVIFRRKIDPQTTYDELTIETDWRRFSKNSLQQT